MRSFYTILSLTFTLVALLLAAPATAQVIFDDGCGGNSDWDCADNWDTDTVPTVGDDVSIGSFTVTGIFSSASINSLSLASTTLNTDGTMSVGELDWSGGAINAGALLTITGTGSEWSGTTKTLSGTTLAIAAGAEVAQTAGNFNMSSDAVVENAGLYDITSDDDIDFLSGAGTEFINESTGTLRKSVGVAKQPLTCI